MNYYVYKHIRNDTKTVFYIGKGQGSRAFNLYFRSDYHKRIVKKHGCSIEIIYQGLSENEAFKKEMELIREYKVLGQCEANFTLGGEGCTGRTVSIKTRSKISKKLLGTKQSESSKQKRSLSLTGKPSGMLGKVHKEISNLKRSKSLKNSNLVNRKSIKCLNTGEIFKSLLEACLILKLSGTSNLSKVLKGTRSHINGLKFEYVVDNG